MVTSNSDPLVELEAEIVELEREIPDRATRDRLLAIPKNLFALAQDYHRKGSTQEARLTINCAYKLLERVKIELNNRLFLEESESQTILNSKCSPNEFGAPGNYQPLLESVRD